MKQVYKEIKSKVGTLRLVANDRSLLAILWEGVTFDTGIEDKKHPILLNAEKQLVDYFSGKRTDFDLPLEFQGTPFQNRVWSQLQKIPFGKTISYSELAMKIGSPKAARAVGAAVGRNPLSIVVPCHRVIGADGSLTGFAGGLAVKKTLLEHEGL